MCLRALLLQSIASLIKDPSSKLDMSLKLQNANLNNNSESHERRTVQKTQIIITNYLIHTYLDFVRNYWRKHNASLSPNRNGLFAMELLNHFVPLLS